MSAASRREGVESLPPLLLPLVLGRWLFLIQNLLESQIKWSGLIGSG